MALLDDLETPALIAFGAILGANTRFLIYKNLEKANLSKNYIILLINTFSSFFLGFIVSLLSKISSLNYSYQLGLLFSIGFLGSLSTFSTFIYDLYELIIQLKFYRALKLCIISLILGILSFAVGFVLVL